MLLISIISLLFLVSCCWLRYRPKYKVLKICQTLQQSSKKLSYFHVWKRSHLAFLNKRVGNCILQSFNRTFKFHLMIIIILSKSFKVLFQPSKSCLIYTQKSTHFVFMHSWSNHYSHLHITPYLSLNDFALHWVKICHMPRLHNTNKMILNISYFEYNWTWEMTFYF